MIIRPILSFEAVRRHAAHGNALFEARRCGTCEPRRIELRCRHGNMESQWYLERHVVHYADAPGKFHALYSHYTFPGRVESRSRGNYTLLLLVYHGERGEKGIGEGTDCFNFHVLPRSTTWRYCSYILFQIIFFTLSLSLLPASFFYTYPIPDWNVDSDYTSVRLPVDTITRAERTRRPEKSFRATYCIDERPADQTPCTTAKLYPPITVYSAPGTRVSPYCLCDATYLSVPLLPEPTPSRFTRVSRSRCYHYYVLRNGTWWCTWRP